MEMAVEHGAGGGKKDGKRAITNHGLRQSLADGQAQACCEDGIQWLREVPGRAQNLSQQEAKRIVELPQYECSPVPP